MTTVICAYRFALDPTPAQQRALLSHAGAVRVAFNFGLALVTANEAQRAAERSYGIREEELTPKVDRSAYGLRKAWNAAKHQVAPWWKENSKEAYACGCACLAAALKNHADSKHGKRAGKAMGSPRFKSRRRSVPSVRFTTGGIRVDPDRHHVVLPKLGRIKTHESTRKLTRRIEASTARILSATVRRTGGCWFCSFTVEIQRAKRGPRRPGAVVGVDLGIRTLAVLSDGPSAPNSGHLEAALRRIGRRNRALARRVGPYDPTTRRHRVPSNRWRRAKRHVSAAHARVANLRRDGLHKLTTAIAATYGTVVIEDLHVAGMLRNRRLARRLADASFGELRRQLDYKTRWHGGRLVVADRWYPSSKTCSACGAVKAKLALAERTFTCTTCGLRIDRDANAAANLRNLAGQIDVAGSGPETRNGRGADQKTRPSGQVAMKRQPRTEHASDKTGTTSPQGEAA